MSNCLISSRRSLLSTSVVLALGMVGATGGWAFSALDRPALLVRAPERSFLQSAAVAGQRLVAVGERGVVLLSDDLGARWRQARAVPVSTTLTAVHFVDARMGWAVGHGGVVLHSIDGGENWSLQADGRALAQAALAHAKGLIQSDPQGVIANRELKAAQLLASDGPDKPLLDVYFRDARLGWVVGAYNLFFETRDGGQTWVSAMGRLDNPRALHLYAIRAQGDQVFVVGEQGQMHRSPDGGKTFQTVNSPYKGSWFTLAMDAGGILVAGLRGNAFHSVDQGASWQSIAGAPPVSFVASTVRRDGSVVLGNQAGQLWSTRAGKAFGPISAPPMPPLSGVLDLGAAGLLITGAGGPVPVSVPHKNGPIQ